MFFSVIHVCDELSGEKDVTLSFIVYSFLKQLQGVPIGRTITRGPIKVPNWTGNFFMKDS